MRRCSLILLVLAGCGDDARPDAAVEMCVAPACATRTQGCPSFAFDTAPAGTPVDTGWITAIGDIDGDNRADAVVEAPNGVRIAFGAANLSAMTWTAYDLGDPPRQIFIDDVDGDGKNDVVIAMSKIQVLHNDGTRNLVVLPAPSLYFNYYALHSVRATCDGRSDLLALVQGEGGPDGTLVDALFIAGNGDGSFDVVEQVPLISQWLEQSLIGDFNEDGTTDLLGASKGSPGSPGGAPSTPAQVDTYVGTRGSYALTVEHWDIPAWTSSAPPAATGDLDADCHLDAVVAVDKLLWAGAGDGTGRFTALPMKTLSTPLTKITLHDMTGDGNADVIATNFSSELVIMRSTGTGFEDPIATGITGLGSFEVADFDGDMLPDLLSPSGVIYRGSCGN